MAVPEMLTLREVQQRKGTDDAVGMIDEVNLICPELRLIKGRTIKGTQYKMEVRTGLPKAYFRKANEGVPLTKSTTETRNAECKIIDEQMRVDKAVADADQNKEELMARQITAAGEAIAVLVGNQFYYGTSANGDGFVGIRAQTSPDYIVNSGANSGNVTSVYGVYEGLQGVHFIFGNERGIDIPTGWLVQQVPGLNTTTEAPTFMTAYTNGVTGWLGLSYGSTASSSMLANVNEANPPTDKKLAELLSKLPLNRRPKYWMMTRQSAFWLQNSRSTITTVAAQRTATGKENFPPPPLESNDIPIVITDSISNAETVLA